MTPADLAAWRDSLRMSQRAAAAALGCSLATYQAMERGRAWATGKPITISRRTELACQAIAATEPPHGLAKAHQGHFAPTAAARHL
jgi:DNA-binding XRE family transcriptional regulator